MVSFKFSFDKIRDLNCLSLCGVILFLLVSHCPSSLRADDKKVWIACASQGQTCNLQSNNSPASFAVMRIGGEGKYHFIAASGVSEIPCSIDVVGDANFGKPKECAYTEQDIFGLSKIEESAWGGPCAHEGRSCTNESTTHISWMRYGRPAQGTTPAKWVYVPIGPHTTVKCSNEFVGVDPAYGHNEKSCWMLNEPIGFAKDASPTKCANEGKDCDFTDSALRAVQIRPVNVEPVTNARTVLVSSPELKCGIQSFKLDPSPGTVKQCYTQPLQIKVTNLVGSWKLIATQQCPGGRSNCTISRSIGVGTTRSQGSTNTQQESLSIERAVEAGFSIKGASGKVSSTIAATWLHSSTYSVDLQESLQEITKTDCDIDLTTAPRNTTNLVSYFQFRTSQDISCVSKGTCSQTTNTIDTICGLNLPPNTVPQCLPGYFDKTDSTLQTCVYK
ncbi:hypothetical protein [Thalassospira lucentensis]|uniref:hypothetical protein n=1 Tax=Thalassospira lucentensis TaxID=168935 RepID=UPI00142D9BBF|nr:hypothetical protein [Thalassospira lucentensis]NIZ00106.1 hypothetical protein [Thalassospira lucentensis]